MSPEMANMMPSIFAVYVPVFLLYLALMVSMWFAAPFICRLAIARQIVDESDQHNVIVWNSVMVFLVGTLFLGWGMTRLAEDFTPYFQARARHIEFMLNVGTKIHVVISILLIGFGAIFMSKSGAICGWIARRTPNKGEAGGCDGEEPRS